MRSRNNVLLITAIFLLAPFSIFAQNGVGKGGLDVAEDDLLYLVEQYAENSDADFDFETYMENLRFFYDNPINLNRTDFSSLAQLGILNDIQLNAFFDYRENLGRLLTIYELQSIPHFDLQTIRDILPFVRVNTDLDDFFVPIKEQIFDGDYEFFARYQQVLNEQAGYQPGSDGEPNYLGSPFKLLMRFRYRYMQRLSYGITAEKDQGEEFFSGSQKKGFDYYSYHLFVRNVWKFSSIALGDYEAKFGQGLILYSGFGYGKSSFVMDVKKAGTELRPYTSVNENLFLRGAAATMTFGDFNVTGIFSLKSIDANVTSIDTTIDDLNAVTSVSSFQNSGFHRTQAEVEDKDAIKQMVFGGNVNYRTRKWELGLTAVHTKFGATLNRTLYPYNQFEFSGEDQLTNIGANYSYILKNLNFFGELAVSDNGGIATIHGILASLDPKVDVSVVYRYYQKDYQSLFANAFGESTNPNNETGIYMGMKIKPSLPWTFDVYFDFYKFPWVSFSLDRPAFGTDYMGQITYKPSRSFEMYSRVRREIKPRNLTGNDAAFDFATNTERTSVRLDVKYKLTKEITLKSRAEVSFFNDNANPKEKGFMVYQDFTWQPWAFPVSVTGRVALFGTDSYNTRIYAYENDVLYSFSIPPYFNKGIRTYLVLRYKVVRGLDLWFRIAQTYNSNVDQIGSGNETVDGKTKTDVKVQMRLKF